jgi:hypothetical protein
VCKCHDLGDDAAELLALKTLLSVVTSISLIIHGFFEVGAVATQHNGEDVVLALSFAKAPKSCHIRALSK